MNQDSITLTPGKSPWPTHAIRAFFVLVLTVLLFAPTDTIMDVRLDPSNYASYSLFTAKHFQYGPEVMPMAGPLGFVPYGSTYGGHLYAKRMALELFTKLCISILVAWLFFRSPNYPWLRWFWVAPLALLAPFISDIPYTIGILLAGLCIVHHQHLPGRWALAICCALAGFLGMLTLFKGTHTSLSIATLGVTFLQAALVRDFRRWFALAAAYLGSVLVLLLAAGQNPLHFPAYVRGMLELSSGYNLAMGLDEPDAVFRYGLVTFLLLELLLAFCVWRNRRDPVALGAGALFAGFTFVFWKHGFVRADGHVLIFFQYSYLAAAMILMCYGHARLAPSTLGSRLTAGTLALIIIVLGIHGDGVNPSGRNIWVLQQAPKRLTAGWQQLTSPEEYRRKIEEQLAEQRDFYSIPRLRQVAGNQRIDFFGYELGYLIINQFNYRPRPVGGGSFSTFTPRLHDLNVANLLDPARRPELFLVNLQTIDDRFTPQDDAGTLRALLANYVPVESGADLTLYRVRTEVPVLPEPELIRTQPVQWDTVIELPPTGPDEMILVSFDLPLNLLGRARTALYKPPLVFMDLGGEGLYQPENRRIIPTMVQRPVPLSPVLETNTDLENLYLGKTGKIATSLRLETGLPQYFDSSRMSVSFYRTPRPAPAPPAPLRLINSRVSRVDPVEVEAFASPILRDEKTGMVAQILSPPSFMRYQLRGDENQLVFSYGMSPPTYNLPTDGVDIWVELVRPGRPAQRLFFRHLSPRFRHEDQGVFHAKIPLPPFPPGSELFLRAGRGPDGNGAWDLPFFTNVNFARGPYVQSQFPGFNTMPISAEADVCGPGLRDGREVFMLFSPGSVTFQLTGKEKRVVFSAGMLPGAYSNGGASDGVEFQAVFILPDGSEHILGRYHSNPLEKEEDRPDRTFFVPIPANTGAKLSLRVLPGPSGSDAWDWAYLSGVTLE